MTRIPTLALGLAGLAGAALAQPQLGETLGTSAGDVAAALSAQGYEVTRYAEADGRIDVIAVKDGQRLALYLDPETGAVRALEARSRGGPQGRPGPDHDMLRAALAAEGYELLRIEPEGRGRVEAYAMRDGRRHELKIDGRTGEILSAEEDE